MPRFRWRARARAICVSAVRSKVQPNAGTRNARVRKNATLRQRTRIVGAPRRRKLNVATIACGALGPGRGCIACIDSSLKHCLNVGNSVAFLSRAVLSPWGPVFRLTRSRRFFRLAQTSIAGSSNSLEPSPLNSPPPARPDRDSLRKLESSIGWCTTKRRVRRENVRYTCPLRPVHHWLEGHAQRNLLNARIICLAGDCSKGTAVILKRAVFSIRESPRG